MTMRYLQALLIALLLTSVVSAQSSTWVGTDNPSDGGGGGTTITYITKDSDESVTSSTTLQDDDDFTFSALANTTYEIEIVMAVSGNTLGDISWDFTVPAGTTGWNMPVRLTSAATTAADNFNATAEETPSTARAAATITGTPLTVRIIALYTTTGTAGAITLRWAQTTSNGTATTVEAGSWMKYIATS